MLCSVGAENWVKFGKSPFGRVSTSALAQAAPVQGWVKIKHNLWAQCKKKGLVSKPGRFVEFQRKDLDLEKPNIPEVKGENG